MSKFRITLFLGILTAISSSVHYWIWLRLVHDTNIPEPLSTLATTLLIAFWILIPFAMIGSPPRKIRIPLNWIVFTWMGTVFLFIVLLVPAEIARFLILQFSDSMHDEFLSRVIAGFVCAVGLCLSLFSLYQGLGPVAIKRIRIPLSNLPPQLQGLRIVQLTDIHVSSTTGAAFIAKNRSEGKCIATRYHRHHG